MDVTVIDHPLAKVNLSRLRDAATGNAGFRSALQDLTVMLVYEAARDLPVCTEPVRTPLGHADGHRLAVEPVLVPVLRAGLGMAECALRMLPQARMGFVGLARDEETLLPEPYMTALPDELAGQPVLVLDPMLATGGSMVHTVRLLAERGTTEIVAVCGLVAPEGLDRLRDAGLPVRVVTACVDERLNDSGFIVPGLGDAGDRQFGPT
ncbi:uracil phosphoribosyltransferase [Haloechinothrix sp. LS1_15]|uniref:uracil phosphoribosyltransferase n=1 Tax=Haloechinothrix sp. LS1_15 TaxID=2652248 RepID=UPI002945A733|nr:uracil phosphoribosyltransferase [Haloechinothrix sp. LS1_15]MDV6012977.1 uracil phosphoribosyltransferase [Haloechinothrix sp. LS1_15]